ncbi:TetR/AcrR family transcriptional regulator [Pseudonocardia sp. GCM10023141]|uniref:TetR/AcrR family transcriptional regulator n=1 Tax=Pseudonocardia sp. GCM10023141 TaxID=3252653 RepID=UPI0036205211
MRTAQHTALPAERLLDAAAALFDREGIRAVGIERLISEADVARASLYQNFGSKDGLVAAWLRRQDQLDRAGFARATRGSAPADRIRAVFELAATGARRRRYRGCLYVNALTEFPDPHHPVHQAVAEHREWLRRELHETLQEAGAPDPAALAERIQLLYDGGLVGTKAAHTARPVQLAAEMAVELLTPRG